MRTLAAALLLLALPAAAQEPDNGLLVYGSLWNARIGGGLQSDEEFGAKPWGALNVLGAGIGYHWGRFGVMVSTREMEVSSVVAPGDWSFTVSRFPVRLHAVYGASGNWQSTRPVFGAYVEHAHFGILTYTEVGAEASYRFYVFSPSVRAAWRWTDPGGWSVHDFTLSAGLELGGIWALRHHE